MRQPDPKPPHPWGHTTCERCDNTRYIRAPDYIVNPGTERERRYTQVTPCPQCNP